MLKRDFLKNTAALALGALFSPAVLARAQEERFLCEARATPLADGPFTLPPLPYAFGALEPHIDARTMEIHHDAHHKTYVSKLNEAIAGKPEEKMTLAELLSSAGKQPMCAQQRWRPLESLLLLAAARPRRRRGTHRRASRRHRQRFWFLRQIQGRFCQSRHRRFGSGWAWLLHDPKAGKLIITSTPNQDNPLMDLPGIRRGTPVLGLDVWEHAYYLQHQNKRPAYVAAFWNVVNWPEAGKRYEAAKK